MRSPMNVTRRLTVLMIAAFASAPATAGDCTPAWDPAFGVPGAPGGIAFDFASWDDGGGTDLYVSGTFTSIAGVSARRVARWDGSAWSRLGLGISNNEVYAIEGYGDGLYAAGYFDDAAGVAGTAKLARWNGDNWESIGAELALFSNQLWGLTTWDDGDGEGLYVVGNYQDIGGPGGPDYIAKWDGSTFSALGAPIGGGVPLIIFDAYAWDDGSGEQLYAGGRFLNIDGVPANRIAKWDGAQWSALGSGLTGPGPSPSVMSMVAFDDGTGEQLYVAGQTFDNAGGVPVSRIARWDGSTWSAVGAGFDDGIVWAVEVFDDGTGAALYAFGTFTTSGGAPMAKVAKWDGTSWQSIGANSEGYGAIVHDDGSGATLYAGGQFTLIGGVTSNRVARIQACPTDTPGDATGDGVVDVSDLVDVILAWGPCPVPPTPCPADFDGSGVVDVSDLVTVILNWG